MTLTFARYVLRIKADEIYFVFCMQSFTQAEEFVSAQHPVSGAAIDFVRLLIDQESSFLISLNPLSDVKEVFRIFVLEEFACFTKCIMTKIKSQKIVMIYSNLDPHGGLKL